MIRSSKENSPTFCREAGLEDAARTRIGSGVRSVQVNALPVKDFSREQSDSGQTDDWVFTHYDKQLLPVGRSLVGV